MGKTHDGSEVARWERRESKEVTRWEVPGLIGGGGCSVSPRFHHFVSDVNQRNEGAGRIQGILVWSQEWKDSP